MAIQCCWYLFIDAYLDHIEGNVVISAWQFAQGTPLYQSEDAAPVFANYYGPLAYLVEVPALLLLGASTAATKLTSLVALTGTVIVLTCYFLRDPAEGDADQGIFFLVAALLLFAPISYWVRPDPIETFAVAAAVAATRSGCRPLWVGFFCGVAVNLKAHAGLYFLPILVDLWWIAGWRALLLAAGAGAATALLPFLAPGISAQDYLTGLSQQIVGRAQTLVQLPWVVICLMMLLLPIAIPLAAQRQPARTTLYAVVGMAAALVLLYPATFPGAGAYHFLPLVPVLADARYRLRPCGVDAALSPFALLIIGLPVASANLQLLAAKRETGPLIAQALALARERGPGTVQVGYGDNLQSYMSSQLIRTVLALHSYPAFVDAQILMELHQIGIEGSARWIPALQGCRARRWLLPRGETPFAVANYFYDGARLFGERFRDTFFSNYSLVGSSEDLDVWECKRQQTKQDDGRASTFMPSASP